MDKIEKKYREEPNNKLYIFTIVVTLLAILIWSSSVVNFDNSAGDGLSIAKNIFKGILNPDKELLFSLNSKGVIYLLLETIAIAFLGTVIGAIISIPLAFLASSNIVPKQIAFLTKLLIMVIRTIPAIVYGLMFIRVTGPGPFAGLMTSISIINLFSFKGHMLVTS